MVNFSGEPSGWVFPLLREYLLCGLLHQLDLTTANEMPGSHKKQLFPSQFFVFCSVFCRRELSRCQFGSFSTSRLCYPGTCLLSSRRRFQRSFGNCGVVDGSFVTKKSGVEKTKDIWTPTKGGGNSHGF